MIKRQMRNFLILTIGTAVFLFGAKPQDGIEGVWLSENGQMKVEIYENGDVQSGKIVWLAEPTDSRGALKLDENNPEKKLRDRPLMGMDIMEGLQFRNGQWEGSLYAAKRGVTTDVKVRKAKEDELLITVSYRGFSRQQTWKRASL